MFLGPHPPGPLSHLQQLRQVVHHVTDQHQGHWTQLPVLTLPLQHPGLSCVGAVEGDTQPGQEVGSP